MTLTFAHVGPPVLPAAPLPPLPHQIGDYALAYDAAARRVVYAISPSAHQFGPAWSFDGTAWQPLTSTTVRVGSATQRWRGVFDPVRRAVVGWSFEHSAGPVGVVLSPAGGVLGAAGLRRYDDGAAPALACGGAFPEAGTSWDGLAGVFGADPQRGVTVCLTERGLWELDDRTWTKKADADGLVPDDVDGDTSFGASGGAGACYDARRGRVLF